MRRELKTVAKRALRKRADFDIDKIADEVYEAASDWIRSHFGDEEVDYLYVGATDSNMIEVRDELSYDENGMLIHDALNPIVQSYDPTSFFDFYAATVLRAGLWDEEARKETWYVKHDVNPVDGEYDLVWIDDLDANPYVVKKFDDGAWHVGILGFDDKIYFGDTGRDDTFWSWDDAMESIPSSDIYEFVRVGSNAFKRASRNRRGGRMSVSGIYADDASLGGLTGYAVTVSDSGVHDARDNVFVCEEFDNLDEAHRFYHRLWKEVFGEDSSWDDIEHKVVTLWQDYGDGTSLPVDSMGKKQYEYTVESLPFLLGDDFNDF